MLMRVGMICLNPEQATSNKKPVTNEALAKR